jgi:hypothetical protein
MRRSTALVDYSAVNFETRPDRLSLRTTLRRSGTTWYRTHLFPGNEDEAAALLDKYLEERETAKPRARGLM